MNKGFTTIQISEDVKNKLLKIKEKKNVKYNDIIEQMLELYGGILMEDVIRIDRNKIALSLKYWEETSNNMRIRDITFQELRTAEIGTVFTANMFPSEKNYSNSSAKLVFREDDVVILIIEEVFVGAKGDLKTAMNVIHVNLF